VTSYNDLKTIEQFREVKKVTLSREDSGYFNHPYFITEGGYKYGLKELYSKYRWKAEIQEDFMGTINKLAGDKLSIDDVKIGDTITVTRDVVVSSVDSSEGVVVEKGTGNKVRMQQPKFGSFSGKTLPTYAVTLKARPVDEPKNWPPQQGDKWRVGSSITGTEYTIQQTSYKRSYSTTRIFWLFLTTTMTILVLPWISLRVRSLLWFTVGAVFSNL
jgi:hypothetical protein